MKPKSDYRDFIKPKHQKIFDNQIDIATDRDNRIKRAAELTNSCSARTKALATPKSEPTLRQQRKLYESSNENITTPNRSQKTPIINHPRTLTTPVRKFSRKSGMNSRSRIPITPIRTKIPTSCFQPKLPSLSSSGHLQKATPTKIVIAPSIATPPICESKEFLAQQKTPSNCESVAKNKNFENVTIRKKRRSNGTPRNQFTRSQTPLRSPAL
uniref:Uncharacterized protein n=1 Tax=Panagrolaimus davidi TaxID=227884 RepID=A0A914P9T1_9BILA